MNCDQFVDELKKNNLSRVELEKLHISDSLIRKEMLNYICVPREHPSISLFVNSEVLNLLNKYDCTNVVIGVLTLYDKIEEIEDFYLIGQVEADILAVNKITLSVQVLDYTDISHVIFNCAKNGSAFLDALLACAEYFSVVIKSEDLTVDNSVTYSYVKRSVEKAGGEEYLDFYKLLLAYW